AAGLRRAVENGVDDAAHSPRDTIPDDLISLVVERDVALVPTIDVYQLIAETNGTAAEWNATTLPVMYDNLRRFEAAGGTLALGDDYGGYPGVELGMMSDEIAHWLAAGLSPMRVISAATEGGATASGIEDETGTLERGKTADILVVDGDPLTDMNALERTSLVTHGGEVVFRNRAFSRQLFVFG
ncbi:MAG: amidohydrolase family protein, partial [Rubrobacteraceae bacterium]